MKGKDVKEIIGMHLKAYIKDDVEYSITSVGSYSELSFKLLPYEEVD